MSPTLLLYGATIIFPVGQQGRGVRTEYPGTMPPPFRDYCKAPIRNGALPRPKRNTLHLNCATWFFLRSLNSSRIL